MTYTALHAKIWGLPKRDQEAFENRSYYEDDLDELFAKVDRKKRPQIPSSLCKTIVDKSVSHVFPEGTSLAGPKSLEDTIKGVLESTRLMEKLGVIGREGHITGTVALKSVLNQESEAWTLDLHPCESLGIETDPLDAEKVLSIRIRFRYQVKEGTETVTYWHQERWTDAEYTVWKPQREIPGKLPDFTDAMIDREASGPHDYGEIPITVIAHELQVDSPYGLPEITPALKAYSRELAILTSKVGVASQFITVPALKRINDQEKQPVNLEPGALIDLTSDGQQPADLAPLDYPETPESVFTHIDRVKALAYEAAQVTNPDVEKEMRAGGTVSSVAWKAFNYHFVKKIGRLRVRYGEAGVEAHVEKILRMGQALGLAEFGSVNPEDEASFEVELIYPPFFEPTVEEKTAEILLLKEASLPADELGRRVASILGISNEDTIQKITANLEEEREALKPQTLKDDTNGPQRG